MSGIFFDILLIFIIGFSIKQIQEKYIKIYIKVIIQNQIINVKKMSKNIPDIKKTFVKHLLNTFGIKNGPPPEPPAPLEAPAPFLMTKGVQKMF